MRLQINGKEMEEMDCGASTLAELVAELGLPPDSLIVEHNASIIRQQRWENTALQQDDTIELLNFVGGG